MNAVHEVVSAILVIVCLYALALLLRQSGTLEERHSLIFARVVTDLCLPATIFASLARRPVRLDEFNPALVMLGVELSCMILAWMVTIFLGYRQSQQGAILFCSAFGSSTFLGYSVITQMFPGSSDALRESVLISEIGVGYPIFILGPILAAHFGSRELTSALHSKSSLHFFRSPVFLSLIIGLLWGYLRLPGEQSLLLSPIFKTCSVLAAALTPLAILSVGLMFKPFNLGEIAAPLVIVILLKLVIQPLLAGTLATQLGLPELWKQCLVLLAAMPPAVLGAVFLRRYGGDASLASALLLAATFTSCVTVIGVFWLMR